MQRAGKGTSYLRRGFAEEISISKNPKTLPSAPRLRAPSQTTFADV